MPKDYSRSERVADAIQRELVLIIRNEMRDPRIDMVNITAVDVTRDMSSAKVFVNFVITKSDEDAKEAVAVLNKASGFIRTHLAKMVRLRIVPSLAFYFDGSSAHGQQLSALIDYAVSTDKRNEGDQ